MPEDVKFAHPDLKRDLIQIQDKEIRGVNNEPRQQDDD
jgi:hypothetical protein